MPMLMQQPADAVQARLNVLLDRQADYVSTLAGYQIERAIVVARMDKLSGAERTEAMRQLELVEHSTEIYTSRMLSEQQPEGAAVVRPESAARPVITPRP